MMKNTKTTENTLRRILTKHGCRLKKSRTNGDVFVNGVYQGQNANDRGGYQIVDASTNTIVAGEHFDLSLSDVANLAKKL